MKQIMCSWFPSNWSVSAKAAAKRQAALTCIRESGAIVEKQCLGLLLRRKNARVSA
jgi:hypothetical protein